ncbi:Hypothetical predicted protein [Xyrichtys novacula]|uniref:Uncharacterized protein n=1 Tax=Xyrichtys novacula TaxID=13765 RepID=A0AAV1FX07_XYRNO|nr:Hypothetical predicted protein [Xyrichtys novacula]
MTSIFLNNMRSLGNKIDELKQQDRMHFNFLLGSTPGRHLNLICITLGCLAEVISPKDHP